jgi:hypothetical protein
MRVSRPRLIKGAVIGTLLVVVFLITIALTESTPPSKIYDFRLHAGLVREDGVERLANTPRELHVEGA